MPKNYQRFRPEGVERRNQVRENARGKQESSKELSKKVSKIKANNQAIMCARGYCNELDKKCASKWQGNKPDSK